MYPQEPSNKVSHQSKLSNGLNQHLVNFGFIQVFLMILHKKTMKQAQAEGKLLYYKRLHRHTRKGGWFDSWQSLHQFILCSMQAELKESQFGKNTHITRICTSVTLLRSFENASHLRNLYPNAAKLDAIERGKQLHTA